MKVNKKLLHFLRIKRVIRWHRVQKFDSNGNFITKWGSKGTGDGQFNGPNDIALDPSGNIYVLDSDNGRVQKFDSNGNFITKWGSGGIGDGQFYGATGIAVDSSGNVYVADTQNHRIQKFTSEGNFIANWKSEGNGLPNGIAVDSSGKVYVSDSFYLNSNIQVFSPVDNSSNNLHNNNFKGR
jgi:tripartite motif-containing protein 71